MQLKELTKVDLTLAAMLADEISAYNDMIEWEKDAKELERLKDERTELIARLNKIYGTDHIVEGSRIEVIN